MVRLQAILIGILVGAAGAEAAGPPIAFVKRMSNGDEIHLMAPDGSGQIRLYKAPGKVQITDIDLRPGGGEIAFSENFRTFKVLAFDSQGRFLPGNPRTIRAVSSPCTLESPDYHPSDGRLLFVEGCSLDRAVRTVAPGASAPGPTIFSSRAVMRARWSHSGDLIYWLGIRQGGTTADPWSLHRYPIAAATHEDMGEVENAQAFDITRTGDRVFWGDEQGFRMLDMASATSTSAAVSLACPRGSRMSRSPDDSRMVFQSIHRQGKGNYVMTGATNCASDPTALTGAGSWGILDWRN